jgi:hypothetical protein
LATKLQTEQILMQVEMGLYKDLFSPPTLFLRSTVTNIWQTNPGNATPAPGWPTEAWSGFRPL